MNADGIGEGDMMRFDVKFNLTGAALGVILGLGSFQGHAVAAEGEECINQLRNPDTEMMDCTVSFETDAESAAKLREVTGNAVLAAKCNLKVDVNRRAVFQEVSSPGERAFQVPPQTGKCTFFTSKAPWSPEFSVAPNVQLLDGTATGMTLNVKFTKNVPRAVGAPVENWVNTDAKFQAHAVKEINKFLATLEE